MEEKLRKLNYELDAITKSMADDMLFIEVVEDFVKEFEDRISALKSLEYSMIYKGFDKKKIRRGCEVKRNTRLSCERGGRGNAHTEQRDCAAPLCGVVGDTRTRKKDETEWLGTAKKSR